MNLVEILKDYIDGIVMGWPGAGRKALLLDKETLSKFFLIGKIWSDPIYGILKDWNPLERSFFYWYAWKLTKWETFTFESCNFLSLHARKRQNNMQLTKVAQI